MSSTSPASTRANWLASDMERKSKIGVLTSTISPSTTQPIQMFTLAKPPVQASRERTMLIA